ncbi:LAFE_0H01750g1_1 [Lachancea fermentati]|uniref:LAFE_0H01750g1_1 n=1 Tax=Lachancea fermentati TaxID=4955 RepID=A0A1G4MJB6_LACFM|nr:LAFE_0H01750g1_1 [Lachancea fermentati]
MHEEIHLAPQTPKRSSGKHSPMPSVHLSTPKEINCPLGGFIFPDFRALYSLGLQDSTHLYYSELTLFGFEVYIVEQWALERKYSTLITSFTGNPQDIVHAVKVALPESPSLWPTQFKSYYDELLTYATPKLTEDGTLFITNSSQIPSTLNLLHLECGDLRKIWDDFKVNVDLKRLQCGGRSALLLCKPSNASCEKFAQLYKITAPSKGSQDLDTKSLTVAVVELITIIQISLTYFNLLDPRYKDGILCVFTERAIQDWWTVYGTYYLGVERPKHEGPLGPTTVAGLISLVLTCFFKLMVEDCVSSKEPFDEECFQGGIYNFQRKYNLSKGNSTFCNSYFDPTTLAKLFEVTAKVTNTDIFKIKKVVKSTVQDITGKGYPMQMTSGILTTDLDYLAKNVHGGILSCLWRGKGSKKYSQRRRWEQDFCRGKYHHGDPTDEILKSNVMEKRETEWFEVDSKPIVGGYEHRRFGFGSEVTDSSSSTRSQLERNELQRKEREEKTTNDRVFRSEMNRRPSVPYLPDEVGMMQINYENLPYKKLETDLKRRYSLSVIQDSVERWSLPFEPSLVKIARNLLKMEKEFNWKEDMCYEEHNDDYITFQLPIDRLKQNYENLRTKLVMIETDRDVLDNKHSVLLNDISELDSLASKFKYDIRILDTRMRDVEERVTQFGSKLKSVTRAIEHQQSCNLMKSQLFTNSSELDKYAKEILRGGQSKYHGILMNLWNHHVSYAIREDISKFWLCICEKLFPDANLKNEYG